MEDTQKQEMFRNRLVKVWKHIAKLARRQEIACFRFYDHDLPEFPFAIDWYDGVVHAAEYKRRHGMEDEEHEIWLAACTSGPEAEDRWRRKDERDLRGKCSIIEDDFDRMKRLKDDRVAALKG